MDYEFIHHGEQSAYEGTSPASLVDEVSASPACPSAFLSTSPLATFGSSDLPLRNLPIASDISRRPECKPDQTALILTFATDKSFSVSFGSISRLHVEIMDGSQSGAALALGISGM